MPIMTCEEKLEDAETKYHLLLTGTQRVKVQKGNRSIEYTQANAAHLKAYIDMLKAECGTKPTRKPARVFF